MWLPHNCHFVRSQYLSSARSLLSFSRTHKHTLCGFVRNVVVNRTTILFHLRSIFFFFVHIYLRFATVMIILGITKYYIFHFIAYIIRLLDFTFFSIPSAPPLIFRPNQKSAFCFSSHKHNPSKWMTWHWSHFIWFVYIFFIFRILFFSFGICLADSLICLWMCEYMSIPTATCCSIKSIYVFFKIQYAQ